VGKEEVAMDGLGLLFELKELCCIAIAIASPSRGHEEDQRQHEHESTDARIVVSLPFKTACAVRRVEFEKVTQRPADVRVGMGAGSCQEGQEALTEIGVSVR
jgi:hypothetical protein